jgi:UDP-N-acetylmuramoylalanine--D-glutamate ligase
MIGIGDAPSAAIARRSVSAPQRGFDQDRPGVCMDQSRWPALQGPHNAQNALAAIAACEALGIDNAAIDRGLESFPGLPHRMERVATKNGVLFVNDSKATNAGLHRAGAGGVPQDPLDPRRQGQDQRSRRLPSGFPACREGLYDR